MFIQTQSPRITGVASFTILYTLGFLALSLSLKNYGALPYIGAQLFVMVFVCLAHKRIHYALPLLWSLSFLGLLNLAGGIITLPSVDGGEGVPYYLNELWFSNEWISYKTIVHVYGLGVVTWVNWQTMCNIIHSRYQRRLMPSAGLLLLVVTSAIGYGAIGEILVLVVDLFFSPELVADYANTCKNMTANLCGALLTSVIIKLRNL
ncbi:MAG: hypothetical protein ACI9FG_000554 [Crocinitomicaceae bacterium]|jgi:hypothetical protein